ncbi:MAG: sensor histidine kinase [Bacteroidota bacterium]
MLNFRSSLRGRILLMTGSVITLLMLIISFVILFKWREMIIQNQSGNAVSISRTFAVTVVDAMIFEEKSVYKKENILETYVESFINRLGNVHYVVIFDKSGNSIVQITDHPEDDQYQPIVSDISQSHSGQVRIYEHPQFGWTMEVRQPLLFSGTQWGVAKIGFEAHSIRNEISSVFFLLLSATVIITSVVLIILYMMINRMTSSIERLVRAIDSIDFTSVLPSGLHQPQDEIGYFYQHFRLLQARLDTSKRALEQAQKQVYQAEKLASIGRLASGVAHQVNNPLNGIKSCLYAIKQDPHDQERIREYLPLINEGIDDIEIVVKKLLGFARQQSTSEHRININDAIHKVMNLFELRLKEKKIEIRTALAENLGEVRIDLHLFQEVVMNLILNSYDAIEQNGVISITTFNADADHVRMEIRDNGTGIGPDDLKRIFDPFFTTKDVGIGTGLGLSVCMGIIESHGGRIDVQSTINEETIFIITLPTAHED